MIIVLFGILVMTIIALIPLASRILDFLAIDGIKGIVTNVTDYVDKLLKGFGK
jgi:hypothetical protein